MSIQVELLNVMGDDMMVANCARVSFGKWKEEFDASDAKLLTYLASHEHFSPFRHPQIQLRCTAPLFLCRQLSKHTVGLTWNEISRRYVDDTPEFYYPDSWRSRPDGSVKQGSGKPVEFQEDWNDRYEEYMVIARWLYNYMLKEDIAPEQARMVLPQSMMTSWIWTGSLQAFFHVYRLRIDGHAQLEAQEFAQKLSDVVEPAFPHAWRALCDHA